MKDHHQAWKWAVGVTGALTIALAANFAWAAKPDGPKCTYQNMIELGKGFEEIDPPSSEFAFCSRNPVIGTLNGNNVACLLFDPAGDFFDLGWSLFTLRPPGAGAARLRLGACERDVDVPIVRDRSRCSQPVQSGIPRNRGR